MNLHTARSARSWHRAVWQVPTEFSYEPEALNSALNVVMKAHIRQYFYPEIVGTMLVLPICTA